MLMVTVHDHYDERVERSDKDGNMKVHYRPVTEGSQVLLMPRSLSVAGDLEPQKLHRGLYDVLVYTADVRLDAVFDKPTFKAEPGHRMEVRWDMAKLIVDLSDLSSVAEVGAFTWQGTAVSGESGGVPANVSRAGIRRRGLL